MEMNPGFQVFADMVKQEEKQASQCPLQTPRDASVTHILVFPTSATATVRTPLESSFEGIVISDPTVSGLL
jgi:mediator of RNA polymerase II transcription subunit 13